MRIELLALKVEGKAGVCIEPENVDELVAAVVKLYEDSEPIKNTLTMDTIMCKNTLIVKS